MGRLTISEKVTEKYSMEFIAERLKEYKEVESRIIRVDESGNFDGMPSRSRFGNIFEKDIFYDGRFILHINTDRDGETTVIEAVEYVENLINRTRYDFNINDLEHLRNVVDRGNFEYHKKRFDALESLAKKIEGI